MASLNEKLSLYGRAMDLRVQRHQALASNIANADTPGYKARDFDFSSALQKAMGGQGGGVTLAQTAAGHLPGSGDAAGAAGLQYRTVLQGAVDGNTVDMDVERSQMADNALQYQILAQLVSDRVQGMKTALSSAQS